MPEFDVVIQGGMIIDGTRLPRYRADVGITNGRVAKIGKLAAHQGKQALDANGLMVVPGFIDLHTHYDAQLFWDPYCTISGWHGITSLVIGNCGFGFAPVRPEERERAMLTMTRVEAIPYASMKAGMPWDWVTFPEFLNSVERAPKSVNILPYVPIASLMVWVMGLEEAKSGRRPTPAEEAEMCRLLHEGMNAGGCGWSAQRLGVNSVQMDYDGTPMVTDIMHNETCLAFARVLAERNEGFVQLTFVASSGDMAEAQSHYEELAATSGRPILFNVVQASDRWPERHRGLLAWLERCRAKGLRVYGQGITTDAGFAFTFKDWNLWDDAPAWREATLGSPEERRVKLADPKRRPALRQQEPTGVVTNSFEDIFVLSTKRPEFKKYENHTLQEIGEREGKHPADAMLDIAVADNLETEFYSPSINCRLDYLKEVVNSDLTILGVSDGGAHTKFFTAGRYPTETITRLVRENQVMGLEEAHWRLSALPAWCAGFRGRGILQEGAPADVVVYDYDALKVLPMEIAHDLPG
ncbi:MAG: N-acyl-D-amino-acid deacylase family protein, partial [Candidatus Binatia bacterium]